VTVTDDLPRTVDLVSASGPAGSCAAQGGKVTCAFGTLNPVGVNYGGTQATATIVVVPRGTGTIRNTASVKADQKDTAKGNNKATASTRVLGAPTCRGLTATISGTPGNDVLVGTGGPDVIAGLGGDDRVLSRAGRDLVCAGAGADFIGAGTAGDRVFAGAGPDRLLGRGGQDLLEGAAGNDVIKAGRGSDRIRGGRGFDRCRGGAGADSIGGCER
jgi:Ca2+-binding RTX toxin-like protein